MSFRSFGEAIQIDLSQIEQNVISVSSHSRLITTQHDWAKNKENVEKVIEGLRRTGLQVREATGFTLLGPQKEHIRLTNAFAYWSIAPLLFLTIYRILSVPSLVTGAFVATVDMPSWAQFVAAGSVSAYRKD